MPEWIHDRAKHIRAKNPDMPESESWAIATQQAHAVGKSPKGYGTSEGRHEAKEKYQTPGDDKKTADPGGIGKDAGAREWVGNAVVDAAKKRYGVPLALATGAGAAGALGAGAHMQHRIKKLEEQMKTAQVVYLSPFMSSFTDELEKIANLPAQSDTPNPAQVGIIKPTAPKSTIKPGSTPKYTSVNSGASTSPSASTQPVLDAPPVRR